MDPCLKRSSRHHSHTFLEQRRDFDTLTLDGELASFNLGHVQKIGNKLDQMHAGVTNMLCVFTIFFMPHRTEDLVVHHVGKANDRVQRRTQFMGDRSKKPSARLRRLLGTISGNDKVGNPGITVGNIPRAGNNLAS